MNNILFDIRSRANHFHPAGVFFSIARCGYHCGSYPLCRNQSVLDNGNALVTAAPLHDIRFGSVCFQLLCLILHGIGNSACRVEPYLFLVDGDQPFFHDDKASFLHAVCRSRNPRYSCLLSGYLAAADCRNLCVIAFPCYFFARTHNIRHKLYRASCSFCAQANNARIQRNVCLFHRNCTFCFQPVCKRSNHCVSPAFCGHQTVLVHNGSLRVAAAPLHRLVSALYICF